MPVSHLWRACRSLSHPLGSGRHYDRGRLDSMDEGWASMAGFGRRTVRMRRFAAALLTSLLLLLALAPMGARALAEDAAERPELTITVVETTTAEDIEDSSVPLSPGARTSAVGPVQVGLMGAAFACSVAYVLYTRSCDERAFALRRQLVEAERRQAQGGGAA